MIHEAHLFQSYLIVLMQQVVFLSQLIMFLYTYYLITWYMPDTIAKPENFLSIVHSLSAIIQ